MTWQERFWAKVDKNGPGGCWLWTASTLGGGYGQFRSRTVRLSPYAHRIAYELLVGPVPTGLELDHLCRVRHCVNPAHLEPVSHRENLRRGASVSGRLWSGPRPNTLITHCPKGHAYDETNTRHYRGGRVCRACDNLRSRLRRHSTQAVEPQEA